MLKGAHAAAIHKAFNNCVNITDQELSQLKEWFENQYRYHREMEEYILTVHFGKLFEEFERIETERKI